MTAEELLATMEEPISADGTYCTIDPETRTITVPPEFQLLGVENDKRVERIYFQCPKIVGDNQDLSQDYQLFMNYQNANGDPDAYHINDMEIDGDNITFSWLLDENVTKYKGSIQIAFGAIKPGDETEDPDKNRWNTTINTDCTCLVGLKCTQQVAESNPDALAQIWAAIDELKAGGGITEETDPTVPSWAKEPTKPTYTATEVGADAAGTAVSKVTEHNTAVDAHNDIRLLVQGLTDRLNALADSDDDTLDQMSEIVAYIKSNKSLIDGITTGKVSVSDIVDNLTTNVGNKPLSAAQGVALKALIDGITIPETLPNPQKLIFTGAVTGEYDGRSELNVNIPSGGSSGGGNVDTEKLLAIAIKPKTSGASPLTAKDSAGFDLLDMSVDGLSEQVSTTGAQLFDAAKAKQLDSWIGTGAYRHFDIQLKSNTTYTLFVARNNMYKGYKEEYNAAFALYLGESENLASPNTLFGNSASSSALEVRTFYTFTTTEAPYYINLYTDHWREENLQIAFDELLVNMMLIEGSSVVPYEPYTGGAPSPSPEYPQEIKNLGDMGWFDGLWEQGMYAIADGNYYNNTITICCANPIPAKAGDKVKLEYKSSGYRLFLLAYDTNNNYISSTIETSGTATSITWDSLPENTAYVRFDIQTVDESTITPSDAAHTCVTINDKYMVKVDLVGKNLFDKMKCSNADAWTLGIAYYYIAIPVPKGSKVSFSYAEKPPAGLGFYSCISKKPGEPNVSYKWLYHSKRGDLINNSATFTAESDEIYLSLNSPSINVELFMQYIGNTLQIEVSDVLTDYQPYKEQTVTLTSDRPLTKWDKLEKRNGVWGWVYKSNTVTLDGSEDEHWRIVESGNLKAYTINNLNNIQQEDYEAVFCNKFKGVSFENRDFSIDCICMTSKKSEGNQHVRFNYFSIEDLSAWKIFLQSNPIIINYETAEETFIPFSESEQEQLNSLKTYYPSTTFRVTQNSNLSVQYVADPENYIKNLVTPIATQMLNQ